MTAVHAYPICLLIGWFCCRAPLAPIPSEYSEQLRELVTALLCKDPERRPDVEHVLQMPFVRSHVKQYAEHVRTAVKRRRESFKRSLAEYIDASEVTDTLPSLAHPFIFFKLQFLT